MSRLKRLSMGFCHLSSALLLAPYAQAQADLKFGIIVIDRSASMEMTRGDGSTRCSVAVDMAENALRGFFRKWHGEKVSIMTFAEAGHLQSLTGGFVDESTARKALNGLRGSPCTGNATALAEAICQSADILRASFPAEDGLALYVMTDGEENDSPESECGGTQTVGPDPVSSRWHQQVFHRIIEDSPRISFSANVFIPGDDSSSQDFKFLDYLANDSNTNVSSGDTGEIDIPSLPGNDVRPVQSSFGFVGDHASLSDIVSLW